MSLDEGIDEAESVRFSLKRVLELVSEARQESQDLPYPVDEDDFCDLYFRGEGYLTLGNKPCKGFYRHEIECFGQSFVTLTEVECEFVDKRSPGI